MCITAWNTLKDEKCSFFLVFNRDEDLNRPTLTPQVWRLLNKDNSLSCQVLSGLDTKEFKDSIPLKESVTVLQNAGSWLGVNEKGRISFLNNLSTHRKPDLKSRGQLVTDFLTSSLSVEEYTQKVISQLDLVDGFNLVFGELANQPPVLKLISYYPKNDVNPSYTITDLTAEANVMSNAPYGVEISKITSLKSKFHNFLSKNSGSLDSDEVNTEILSMMGPSRECSIQKPEDTRKYIFIPKVNRGTEITPSWYGTRATYILRANSSALKLQEFLWVHQDGTDPVPHLNSNIELPILNSNSIGSSIAV